jgi:hypothetical protein
VKRPSLEQRYFEVFSNEFVKLVDLKETPIKKRQLLNFPGGVPAYLQKLKTLKEKGYAALK